MALCGVRLGSSSGSVRGLAQAWFYSAQPWFGTLVGLGWQLNICIGAGLATLTKQGLANHGPPFLEPKCCFDAFSMGGERVPILFINIWSEPLEPLLPAQGSVQESAWFKARIGSARDRCSAQGSFFGSRLHDSARLGSSRTLQVGTRVTWLGLTRLGSARLATRGSTHHRSWLKLDLGLRIWTGESTRCSTRLSSEIDSGSARDQVGDRLGTLDSGFGLAGLGRVGAQFASFRSEYS